MCQATRCCNNVATFFSILFTFSAIRGPVKELRLSFMSAEKYVDKIFLLFSEFEIAKVSPNYKFESHELSVEMTLVEDFLKFNLPPPVWISRVFDPPPARIFRSPRLGGCGFFLEQPIEILLTALCMTV